MTQTSSGKTQGSLNIINVKNTLKACSIRVKQGALLIAIIPRALPWARSFWAFSPYLNHMRNFSNVKGLDCEIFTKFLFSGTAPDSYKQKTPATRLYLPDYGCKGTKIFLYLPSTYYVRVLVLSSPDAAMIPSVRGI